MIFVPINIKNIFNNNLEKVMTFDRDMELMRKHNELTDSLSISVKISFGEALQVVVGDLISKYKSCVYRKDQKNIDAFRTVLKYYLSDEEFDEMTKK